MPGILLIAMVAEVTAISTSPDCAATKRASSSSMMRKIARLISGFAVVFVVGLQNKLLALVPLG